MTTALVHAGFAHRRKALAGSLALAPGADAGVRDGARAALEAIGHPADARAERLAPGDWPRLAEALGRERLAALAPAMIVERAYAKLNLVLHVGPPREDGLHPLCSLFASLELADELSFEEADRDELDLRGRGGREPRRGALEAIREAAPERVPPLAIRIEKRIPVAAGLGGGSADAAAALRAANEIAGAPLDADRAPRARGAASAPTCPARSSPATRSSRASGEGVEPLDLPALAVVLLPAGKGLRAGDVYAELDRLGGWRERSTPTRCAPGRAAAPAARRRRGERPPAAGALAAPGARRRR